MRGAYHGLEPVSLGHGQMGRVLARLVCVLLRAHHQWYTKGLWRGSGLRTESVNCALTRCRAQHAAQQRRLTRAPTVFTKTTYLTLSACVGSNIQHSISLPAAFGGVAPQLAQAGAGAGGRTLDAPGSKAP